MERLREASRNRASERNGSKQANNSTVRHSRQKNRMMLGTSLKRLCVVFFFPPNAAVPVFDDQDDDQRAKENVSLPLHVFLHRRKRGVARFSL